MGMIIGFAMFIGVLIGLLVSIPLCILGLLKAGAASDKRLNVWPLFVAGFLICLSGLLLGIPYFPYASIRPGADYGIIMKNFFLRGIFYAASPGVAAIFALLSTRLGCRKPEKENLP